MKQMIRYASFYAIAAMAGGVFFREFTKFNNFTGSTMLGKVHTHLFLLGMVMFLIIALFVKQTSIAEQKRFKQFLLLYNIGVPLTVMMMLFRGIFEVLGTPLSSALDASISGVAGVAHILTGIGIIMLLLLMKSVADTE